MASLRFELDVEMEDGSTHQVVADQRDVARWEVQPFGWPFAQAEERMSMSCFRYLAWSAMTRQQLTALKWEDFDAQCVEALPPDDEADPGDAEDPGQAAQ